MQNVHYANSYYLLLLVPIKFSERQVPSILDLRGRELARFILNDPKITKDNAPYSASLLRQQTTTTGFSSYPDLKALNNARLIHDLPTLEVGCGVGRVMSFLTQPQLEKNADGPTHIKSPLVSPQHLTGINCTTTFTQEIYQKTPRTDIQSPQTSPSSGTIQPVSDQPIVRIIDFREFVNLCLQTNTTYQQIFWLWTAISEYTFEAQCHLLQQLFSIVQPSIHHHAYLAVDILIDTHYYPNRVRCDTGWGWKISHMTDKGLKVFYMPDIETMENYSADIGCQRLQKIPYVTATPEGREVLRCIIVYNKPILRQRARSVSYFCHI